MQRYEDGEQCGHTGCSSHVPHPCESCGRAGTRGFVEIGYDPGAEEFTSVVEFVNGQIANVYRLPRFMSLQEYFETRVLGKFIEPEELEPKAVENQSKILSSFVDIRDVIY